MKLLEENMGVNLHDLGYSQWFLRYDTKSISHKRKKIEKTDQTSKDTIKKLKRQPTEWEKNFATHKRYKGLVHRIYKEPLQLNIREKTQFRNGQRT